MKNTAKRVFALIIVCLFAVALAGCSYVVKILGNTKVGGARVEAEYLDIGEEVLALVNEERAKEGLKPLEYDSALEKVAKLKTLEMYENNYFSHDSPVSGNLTKQFEKFADIVLGVGVTAIGENIAKASEYPRKDLTAEFFVTEWMNSPKHRENILNPKYTHMGFAAYYKDRTTYASQEFLTVAK